jgi:hypothetical protein
MDTSAVFEMFETIKEKLDKKPDKPVEPEQADIAAGNILTEQLRNVIEEVKKPAKVEHQHRHTIDINSSKVFLSLIAMFFLIIGLCYAISEQRSTISQYRENDLKYRYIKMQGQTNVENLYRLERQFRYGDSIRIIRTQVEKYEELVKQQAESIERVRRNNEEVERLRKEAETMKSK